jgi:hypothetical protein
MTIRSAKHPFEIKCEKFISCVGKELKFDYKNMIKWLFFYKPDSKGDRILHIFEVVSVWYFVSRIIYGI